MNPTQSLEKASDAFSQTQNETCLPAPTYGPQRQDSTEPKAKTENSPGKPEALCAQTDPEAFFPEKGGSTRDAKRVCGVCPVREECLQYAMDNDERFGIWGGLSERERRRLRKQAS